MLLQYYISNEYKSGEKFFEFSALLCNVYVEQLQVDHSHSQTAQVGLFNFKENFPENDTKNVRRQGQLFLICTTMHLSNEESSSLYNLPLNDTVLLICQAYICFCPA